MLDIASQIYIVCAAIGSIYLIVGLVMGQLHGHGDAGVGQGDHGFGHVHGDVGLAHGHGPAIGHGHGDPGVVHGHGTAGAHDAGAGHTSESSQSSGSSGIGKHLEPHVDIASTGGHHVLGGHHHADHGPVQLMERKRFKVLRFLQTILSPMTIAVFLAYFGISGLLLARILPFLGPFVPVAAIVASLLITGRVLQLLRWMVFKMNVSTVVRMDDMIGHQAEIITPIKGERLGEITYWTGSTIMQSPAKSAAPGMEFKRGDKVMICDIREGTAYVESWGDIPLDGSGVIETKETLKEQQDA
jgi:membrane protein implicated in regulation of membrane protease activity